MSERGRITRVTGALVEARPMRGVALYELARVGGDELLGEVIRVEGDTATIQVYEDTNGLRVGEPVRPSGEPLVVELGPGLLGSILDGVARPLELVAATTGDFIQSGISVPTLDRERRWSFEPRVAAGQRVGPGDVLGTVGERAGRELPILVPPDGGGTVADISTGEFTVFEPVVHLQEGGVLTLAHRWPVRHPRPSAQRLPSERPFITGQRVFDFFFPVTEGGSVSVPGGFGTGKTVIEQSLARHAAADVVIYVGCGERGNEMADVLNEFPELVDPNTGHSIMDRTVLVVNTSNMPVAAREASVCLGMTIAEYFRDLGYRVAVMADSLSRWAEALREIGSRLQEMPGEEGYPTYMGNRLGKLYERAGRVRAQGTPEREGVITLISAVSPPGGDFSEPVTQASLRVAGALWALDPALAHQRQFPAVDWEISYSLYAEVTKSWFAERVAADWPGLRAGLLQLLQRERELREIAGLVGPEALQDKDRLLLSTAHLIREVVLGQNAYDPNDASSPVEKTYRLALLSHELYESALSALDTGIDLEQLDLEPARRALTNFRNAPADEAEAWAGETAAALAVLRGRAAETSEAAASTEVASTLEPVPTGGVSARAGSTGNE
jgi:V/A-type H+-transporting ATPase subunit A